ncbi:hypothetical protein SODALDRAFT_48874 [Sodiomyces alkalinus F11]|uniref:Uncharacterized protein n=1 Tax=Sodiomyces alkalinus (strain CBS 110278 / VKM F-3762 / F11) TaxID=1314773 RepID=A0A3N2PME5_SODAK|nr:hypothetical protein SODALDRAFT_48874 [Sodiomyces alkalinus F11]ROT35688.1 hypothetical protein SODALDRAFT_48874 [Sodiomyces alkalinus F11]
MIPYSYQSPPFRRVLLPFPNTYRPTLPYYRRFVSRLFNIPQISLLRFPSPSSIVEAVPEDPLPYLYAPPPQQQANISNRNQKTTLLDSLRVFPDLSLLCPTSISRAALGADRRTTTYHDVPSSTSGTHRTRTSYSPLIPPYLPTITANRQLLLTGQGTRQIRGGNPALAARAIPLGCRVSSLPPLSRTPCSYTGRLESPRSFYFSGPPETDSSVSFFLSLRLEEGQKER